MDLKVLSALDSATTQLYHFKAIIIAGMGLLSDAYDLFCIPPVMKLIGRIYYFDSGGVVPASVVSATVAIALVGTAIGQLVFGRLGDKRGRQRVYGMSLLLMVCSSIGCGFSICKTRTCVITSLCFFRFLLGIGIGGDYPLSATIMSEFANKRTRGSFIAAVFSMQGVGILVSSAVIMSVTAAFEHSTNTSRLDPNKPPPQEADLAWRLILMLGAVPAGLTFYWRVIMPETARYTALVENNVEKAAADMQTVLEDVDLREEANERDIRRRQKPPYNSLFSRQFFREHGKDLFACSVSWFLLDVVFYSSNLFQSRIYKSQFKGEVNLYKEAFDLAKFQAIIASVSTIPGYWAAVFLIERAGRKKLQIIGFFFMAIFLFAIGGPYEKYWETKTSKWFIVLYSLTFFFANLGPNTTTFIVPAELFPARFRTTCHGISGAVGKMGSIFGAVGFFWASQSRNRDRKEHGYHTGIGMTASLSILGGVCIVGMVFTIIFTRETKGRSLEENERTEHGGGEMNGNGNGSNTSQRSSASLEVHGLL